MLSHSSLSLCGAWPSSRWWEGLSEPLALRLISFTAGEETCPKSTSRGKQKDIYMGRELGKHLTIK